LGQHGHHAVAWVDTGGLERGGAGRHVVAQLVPAPCAASPAFVDGNKGEFGTRGGQRVVGEVEAGRREEARIAQATGRDVHLVARFAPHAGHLPEQGPEGAQVTDDQLCRAVESGCPARATICAIALAAARSCDGTQSGPIGPVTVRAGPRSRGSRVGHGPSLVTQAEAGKGVEHHGDLLGAGGLGRALHAAGLRAVHESGGVQRNGAHPDACTGPAHEVAGGVEEDFVAVHVGVVVRDLYSAREEVERPRHERAHHEVRAGEGLMHRRWLVDGPDDRLDIVNGEGERVEAPVPSGHVEGMLGVHVPGEAVAGAHQHRDVDALDQQRRRRARKSRSEKGAPSTSWPRAER